eukprot:SAG31_NODE_7924_length_1563_cov_1.324454_1_plen_132_part_00
MDSQWVNRFEREYARRLPDNHGSHSYVGRGIYWPQLAQLFQEFGREQVLVLTLEELGGKLPDHGTTLEVMRRVFAFIGLDADHIIADTEPKNSRGEYSAPMAAETETRLRRFYDPFNQCLYKLLGRNLGWD